MKPRVVLDTNLFLAAYWNRDSASAKIIEACLAGDVDAVYTPEVERELWRMIRKVRVKEEFAAVVSNFIGRAESVAPWAHVDVRSEDPEDQKFLVCAASAEADYLISSDDHLLRLGNVGKTEIMKPGEVWRKLSCKQRS